MKRAGANDGVFADRFRAAVAKLRRAGRGCLHCSTGACYTSFASGVQALLQWRREFEAMPLAAREQHLSWMFWHQGAGQGLLGQGAQQAAAAKATTSDEGEEALPVRCPTTDKDDTVPNPPGLLKRKRPHEVRCATSESESESAMDIAPCGGGVSARGQPTRPKPQRYGSGRPRQGRFSVTLLGHAVCLRAAKALVGVGQSRLRRIKSGVADGRRDGAKRLRGPGGLPLNAPMMTSVLRFLWRLYHSVGEGMPDKFSFKRRDVRTLVVEPIGASGPLVEAEEDPDPAFLSASMGLSESCSESDHDRRDVEEEERAITAAALYAETARLPPEAASCVPGMLRGPLRFLPPTRRVHVYWEYVAWCGQHDFKAASFHTFHGFPGGAP